MEPILDDAMPLPLPESIRPVPETIRASIVSWWHHSPRHTAEAELHLYQNSGYFRGAKLSNAAHLNDDGVDGMVEAYKQATSTSTTPSSRPASVAPGNTYATVATTAAADGKIGCIRMVDIGEDPAMRKGWFSRLYRRTRRYINMLEIGTPQRYEDRDKDEIPVVLVHGYGAGSAFFFRNVGAIASMPHTRLYALDWLGMGRSSRPSYVMPHSPKTRERVEASETFFLTALEQWRTKMKIEKMVLIGHSLGGYLSLAYALHYPERIANLILLSPVGIPEGSLPEFLHEIRRVKEGEAPPSSVPARRPPLNPVLMKTAQWLWDRNISPFGIVRMSTILGPWLMGGYTRRRFQSLEPDEIKALHTYCHGVFTDTASSEHCLADILAPGAFARWPMVQRVAPLKMPIFMSYGSHDWMDVRGGRAAQTILQKAGNSHVHIDVIDKAGHHLYLDNTPAFNAWLIQAIRSGWSK